MSKEKFSFNLLKEEGFSRVGKINTHRGEIDTPTFMTVGTLGTIKSAFIDDVILAGAQIILSNTYHLMLRPGIERIKSIGGLHQFMNCELPILTDSGGFQIMSLSKLVKIETPIILVSFFTDTAASCILSPPDICIVVKYGFNFVIASIPLLTVFGISWSFKSKKILIFLFAQSKFIFKFS